MKKILLGSVLVTALISCKTDVLNTQEDVLIVKGKVQNLGKNKLYVNSFNVNEKPKSIFIGKDSTFTDTIKYKNAFGIALIGTSLRDTASVIDYIYLQPNSVIEMDVNGKNITYKGDANLENEALKGEYKKEQELQKKVIKLMNIQEETVYKDSIQKIISQEKGKYNNFNSKDKQFVADLKDRIEVIRVGALIQYGQRKVILKQPLDSTYFNFLNAVDITDEYKYKTIPNYKAMVNKVVQYKFQEYIKGLNKDSLQKPFYVLNEYIELSKRENTPIESQKAFINQTASRMMNQPERADTLLAFLLPYAKDLGIEKGINDKIEEVVNKVKLKEEREKNLRKNYKDTLKARQEKTKK